MTIRDKLVQCIAINMAKERCGDKNKSDKFLIEAELLLKHLFLEVLIEKSKGDPLEYVTFLENMEEIFGLDYYDVYFIESMIFGEWVKEIF